VIAKVHSTFVASIDRALARPRLVLAHEVQLTLEGTWDGHEVRVRRITPTASDRHPSAESDPVATEMIARALHWLEGAKTIAVSPHGELMVDRVARRMDLPRPLPVLVPFG
jgi:hypothetical protein